MTEMLHEVQLPYVAVVFRRLLFRICVDSLGSNNSCLSFEKCICLPQAAQEVFPTTAAKWTEVLLGFTWHQIGGHLGPSKKIRFCEDT